MNRLDEINKFNKKVIKAYDIYKKELGVTKERLIESFLEENKISKTDFINMSFEKAYNYLLERYKDIQIFENLNRITLLVSNILITYKDKRWWKFSVYGVLDFSLCESEYSDLESFIDDYRDDRKIDDMNISNKIKQFNQTEIRLFEEHQTRVNSFKEEIFEDFLGELKISKEDFTSMNYNEALEFLKANFDKIELRNFYSQKIIALETLLFYYFPNNTFSQYYIPNIFNLEDFESEWATLGEFISNFKKI